jgi:hypothetical protein
MTTPGNDALNLGLIRALDELVMPRQPESDRRQRRVLRFVSRDADREASATINAERMTCAASTARPAVALATRRFCERASPAPR